MTSANDKATKIKNFPLKVILGGTTLVAIFAVTMLCFLALSGQLLPLLVPLPNETWEPETADFHYVQHLPSPDNEHIFALFIDYTVLVGDTGWYIFKFEKDFDVENYQISWDEYRDGSYQRNVIISNYAEGGDHTKNPHIEVIDDTYLVFMRGGLYHSLYDIKAGKTLVNSGSPWHDWLDSEEYKLIQPNPSSKEREKSQYRKSRQVNVLSTPNFSLRISHFRRLLLYCEKSIDEWKRRNLHNSILKIIQSK
jgi:hypothetical protein